MSFSQTTLGAIGFAALFQTMFFVLPSQKFLTVYSVEYSDGNVIANRGVNWNTYADWRVTITDESRKRQICYTVPGDKEHQGWSEYVPGPRATSTMPLDVWVAMPGCYDRLEPVPHVMFVVWTPWDGSEPVIMDPIIFTPSGDSP